MRLNETNPKELLEELTKQYDYDMIEDCVQITFYAKHKTQAYIIGKFYTNDAIGAWLLERTTVKAFSISLQQSTTWNNKGIDIEIVVNI